MSEDFRIDSHKLIYHPERVSEWLKGKDVYPLTVEIGLSSACNHRCIFCGLDYLGYKANQIDKNLLIPNLEKMKKKGVKSVVFAGEGEPLLNRDSPEIIKRSRQIGLDVAMSTNGVLFTGEAARECLPCLTWIRFSMNGTDPKSYRLVHQSKAGDFEKVLKNISDAVQIKKTGSLSTTIGVQLVMVPENSRELVAFAQNLKEIGVDYFTIKPFSKHPQSLCSLDSAFKYEEFFALKRQLDELASDEFQVIFRSYAMTKLKTAKKYERCLGLPFFTYIDAQANVWPCVIFLGKDEFCFGSLKEQDFITLWEGKRRKRLMDDLTRMDVSNCREICRLDEINAYLYGLRFPGAHVNFI